VALTPHNATICDRTIRVGVKVPRRELGIFLTSKHNVLASILKKSTFYFGEGRGDSKEFFYASEHQTYYAYFIFSESLQERRARA